LPKQRSSKAISSSISREIPEKQVWSALQLSNHTQSRAWDTKRAGADVFRHSRQVCDTTEDVIDYGIKSVNVIHGLQVNVVGGVTRFEMSAAEEEPYQKVPLGM
jgi:hypothetical protein